MWLSVCEVMISLLWLLVCSILLISVLMVGDFRLIMLFEFVLLVVVELKWFFSLLLGFCELGKCSEIMLKLNFFNCFW